MNQIQRTTEKIYILQIYVSNSCSISTNIMLHVMYMLVVISYSTM